MNPIRPNLNLTTAPDYLSAQQRTLHQDTGQRQAQIPTAIPLATELNGSGETSENSLARQSAQGTHSRRPMPRPTLEAIPMQREARLSLLQGRRENGIRRVFFNSDGVRDATNGGRISPGENIQTPGRLDGGNEGEVDQDPDQGWHPVDSLLDPFSIGATDANREGHVLMPDLDLPARTRRSNRLQSPVFNGSLNMLEFFHAGPNANLADNGVTTPDERHAPTAATMAPMANHLSEIATDQAASVRQIDAALGYDSSSSGEGDLTSYRGYLGRSHED